MKTSGYYYTFEDQQSLMFGDLGTVKYFAPNGAALFYRDPNGTIQSLN